MDDDSALAVGILVAAGAVGATALFGIIGLMALRWAAIVAGGDDE